MAGMFDDQVPPFAGWTLPEGWTPDNIGRCRSCGAEVLWCVTPKGKKAPVNADGTSHFSDCPTERPVAEAGVSGIVWLWGQANRNRGAGWSMAHLWPRDAGTGIDAGHEAHCGYRPTRDLEPLVNVAFRPAPDDAPRCSRCERRESDLIGHTYYPLGEHLADLARREQDPTA